MNIHQDDRSFGKLTDTGLSADLDLLRTFIAIAETSSFTKAAERVGRTPSAVSMQIKKLEDVIGRVVFTRDSRSVQLTPDGEVLMGYARRMIALSNEMMARFITPELEGAVSLGAPDDWGQQFLPDVLTRFAHSHPNIRVDVSIEPTEYLRKRFEAGELGIVIYSTRSNAPLGDAITLWEEPLVWAGVKGGTAHLQRPLPVSMWQDNCAWRIEAAEALKKHGLDWRIAYKTANTMAQRAAIEANLAIAPVPARFITGNLIALAQEQGLPPLGSCRLDLQLSADAGCCTKALADHIMACF